MAQNAKLLRINNTGELKSVIIRIPFYAMIGLGCEFRDKVTRGQVLARMVLL